MAIKKFLRCGCKSAVGYQLIIKATCIIAALVGTSTQSALATGDANRAFCGSETEASPGFRPYLPDCRAYELVTPSFHNGSQFSESEGASSSKLALVSYNGSRLIAASLGALAETEGDGFAGNNYVGALYEMTRGNGGWSLEALDPPLSRFGLLGAGGGGEAAKFVSASVNLERTAWITAEAGQTQNGLFVREPNGDIVDVGPVEREESEMGTEGGQDSAQVVGADADLSTLVLSMENTKASTPGSLWKGDITHGKSLYEYAWGSSTDAINERPQKEPTMVAVRNKGLLQGNEEAEPITGCGNELGAGSSGSTYNAISDNGDMVFFTADKCTSGPNPAGEPKVNEVYVRVSGEQTLDLSEPPLTGSGSIPGRECTGICESDEESNREAATYESASADGTKVFFMTGQPLLNAAVGGGKCLYEETIAVEGLKSHAASLALVGCGFVGFIRSAEDGSQVYFVSTSILATNANSENVTALASKDNLFYYSEQSQKNVFVATLASTDSADWKANDANRTAQASLNGNFLVFSSHNDLTAGDTTPTTYSQLFEYDAVVGEDGQLRRVSIGYHNDGNITSSVEDPVLPSTRFNGSEIAASQALARSHGLAVTETGVVFFTSAARLTQSALLGFNNVYEYESEEKSSGTQSKEEHIYLISDGHDKSLSGAAEPGSVVELISATNVGEDVFFQTADSLVPQDDNTLIDYYDARINGGSPSLGSSISCDETCQGSNNSPEPSLAMPTSIGDNSEPALVPPPKLKPKHRSKVQRKSKRPSRKHRHKEKYRHNAKTIGRTRRLMESGLPGGGKSR